MLACQFDGSLRARDAKIPCCDPQSHTGRQDRRGLPNAAAGAGDDHQRARRMRPRRPAKICTHDDPLTLCGDWKPPELVVGRCGPGLMRRDLEETRDQYAERQQDHPREDHQPAVPLHQGASSCSIIESGLCLDSIAAASRIGSRRRPRNSRQRIDHNRLGPVPGAGAVPSTHTRRRIKLF